jgi:type II secretory ATPase GspE/PulE/Tfp pilus assembly ATPase PilB-like protein
MTKRPTNNDVPADKRETVPSQDVLGLIPRGIAENLRAFVLERRGADVVVAALEPESAPLRAYLKSRFGESAVCYRASAEALAAALAAYERDFPAELEYISKLNMFEGGNVAKLVDLIITYALAAHASDVHIEPKRALSEVRFRTDGELTAKHTLAKDVHIAALARLKIMANLKIDEYRRPQDGRIELASGKGASLRISIIPTLFGEKAVMRIIDESSAPPSLAELGFSPRQEEVLLRNIEKPFGMIVASGPTGSGKTTTLYSLINLLKKDGINISTLEDPIEGVLEGVNQTQVNPQADLTFVSGLRALLRQDPDVVMVGEIRDSETASMAANAAMTGHLVFSTMHTNDAPSAFVRFLEMKVEDYVIASTLNVVVAQRLVRRICESCAKEEKLPEATIAKIAKRPDLRAALDALHQRESRALEKKALRRGEGCGACQGTGYRGRIGLFEIIEPTKTISELILEHAPAEKIRAAARSDGGFREMVEDGVEKIFEGVTTFDEVLHATRN